MKFRAYIPYNLSQAKEAKLMGDKNISGCAIQFTLQDITGYFATISGKEIFFKPSFTARELIIPWLQAGNIPEMIEEDLIK